MGSRDLTVRDALEFVRVRKLSLTVLLLVNWVFALTFMRLTPICYGYLDTQYSTLEGVAGIALQLPLCWALGAVASFMMLLMAASAFVSDPAGALELAGPLALGAAYYFVVALACFHTRASWTRVSERGRMLRLGVTTLLINPLTLVCFFLSMGV